MAEVRAYFTLTDRVSSRLTSITKKAASAEAALKKLGETLDKINRKIAATEGELRALGMTKVRPSVDLDIRDYRRKFAEVMAMQKILNRQGGVLSSSASSMVRPIGGGRNLTTYPTRMSRGNVARQNRVAAAQARLDQIMSTGSGSISSYYRQGMATRNPSRVAYGNPMETRRLFATSGRVPFLSGSGDGGSGGGGRSTTSGGDDYSRRQRFGHFFVGLPGKRTNKFRRYNSLMRGGRGGWFSGGSLAATLPATGIAQVGLGGAGAIGAGALALAPMLAGLGGLGAILGGTAIPLIAQTVDNANALKEAQQALADAETPEELAEATIALRKAQEALTPVQRSLIRDTERLKSVFSQLTKPIQNDIAAIYTSFTDMTEKLAPTLQAPFMRFGDAGRTIMEGASKFLTDPQELMMLRKFLSPLPQLAIDTAKALGLMAVWVQRVVIAASPLASWMLKGINEYFMDIANNTRDGNVMRSWTQGFDRFRGVIEQLGLALTDSMSAISRMFDDVIPLTIQFLQIFRGRFIPTLEVVIEQFARFAAPNILNAIEEILKLIENLAPPVAKILGLLAKAIEQVVAGFNKLDDMLGGNLSAFVAWSATVLFIFSRFIGLLAKLFKFFDRTKTVRTALSGVFSGALAPAKRLLSVVLRMAAAMAGMGILMGRGGAGGMSPVPTGGRRGRPDMNPYPGTGPTSTGNGGGIAGRLGGLKGGAGALGIGALVGSMFLPEMPGPLNNMVAGAAWGSLFGLPGAAAGAGIVAGAESMSNAFDIVRSGNNASWKNPFNWAGNTLNSLNPFKGSSGGMSASDRMARLRALTPNSNYRNVLGINTPAPAPRANGRSRPNSTNNQTNNVTVNATINEASSPDDIAKQIANAVKKALANMPQSSGSTQSGSSGPASSSPVFEGVW